MVVHVLAAERERATVVGVTPERRQAVRPRVCAREVGHEHERALEDPDQDQRLVRGVVGRDLLGQFLGLVPDLFLGDDHAVDVGGIPVALGHADKGAVWPRAAGRRGRRVRAPGRSLGTGAEAARARAPVGPVAAVHAEPQRRRHTK